MARSLAIALITLFAAAGFNEAGGDKAKDKDFQAQGKLSADDPKDQQRGGPMQTHMVQLKAGKVYTIDMVSTEVDSYLRLLDAKGKQLDEDDDSGNNQNARIIFNCTRDGEYKVVCTTFAAGMTGSYSLTVKIKGAVAQPVSSHAEMIGKQAPDLKGDFALNGKPVSLAELKGKVVLLHFWEPRSTSSVAMLPQMGQWHKAHKTAGLVIVGVTFYPSEINQTLGFDKDTGKLVTTKDADRKSDQALLSAFAEYHKVEHLLLALPKQAALDVFDAYAVNSVPQVVLMDRKGVVRLVDVGGGKSSANVETAMKKLLQEK